jgi:hypothetical protein
MKIPFDCGGNSTFYADLLSWLKAESPCPEKKTGPEKLFCFSILFLRIYIGVTFKSRVPFSYAKKYFVGDFLQVLVIREVD